MPLPFLPKFPFPSVPNLVGVPQVLRSPSVIPTLVIAVVGQAASQLLRSAASAPLWGIYGASGSLAINPDSIRDFAYTADYKVSNAPQQGGQFFSFNKVKLPFENTVRLFKAGELSDREQFLSDLDAILASLGNYTILTPEKAYPNVNGFRAEVIRREAEGAYSIVVDLHFTNIVNVTAQYSNTSAPTADAQNPDALPPTNNGVGQPMDVSVLTGQSAIDNFEARLKSNPTNQ